MRILLLATLIALFYPSIATAAAPRFDPAPLLEALVTRGDAEWRGDRWGERRGDRLGTSAHMVYAALDAQLRGRADRLERVARHYRSLRDDFWNPDRGCYVDWGYFITNADEGWCLAATLLAAGDKLDETTRGEMEDTLRNVCRYLASRSTSATERIDDFRAANQDAFAAAALATAAAYFGDDAIRRDAIAKVEAIAGRVDGPFWPEGGIDRDYQRVGEPAFAIAVDLLWDEISLGAKRATAEMAMRPFATRGLGLETARSESSLSADPPSGDFSGLVAWLNRVPHPLVAHGVQRLYAGDGTGVLAGPWWWTDLSTACMHWAFVRHADRILAIDADPPSIGWGGAAAIEVGRGAGGPHDTADFKAFIAGEAGVAAMFGSPERQNPAHLRAKRAIVDLPTQWNPAGLRYLGWGNRLAVMADDRYGFPRAVFGGDVTDDLQPELVETATFAGFVGSQTRTVQRVGEGDRRLSLDQRFVALGDLVLVLLTPDRPADGLAWELPAAAQSGELDEAERGVTWPLRATPHASGVSGAVVMALDGGPIRAEADALRPFIANEKTRITGADRRQAMVLLDEPMPRVVAPATESRVVLICPAGESVGAERLVGVGGDGWLLTRGERTYVVSLPTSPHAVELGTPAGVWRIEHPTPNFVHVLALQGGRVVGCHIAARTSSVGDRPLFTSDDGARLSMNGIGRRTYVNLTGDASITAAGVGEGRSLIDNTPVNLDGTVADVRFWIDRP